MVQYRELTGPPIAELLAPRVTEEDAVRVLAADLELQGWDRSLAFLEQRPGS